MTNQLSKELAEVVAAWSRERIESIASRVSHGGDSEAADLILLLMEAGIEAEGDTHHAALAAMVADAERLDFLVASVSSVIRIDNGRYRVRGPNGIAEYKTEASSARAAIDTARQAAGEVG